MNRGEHAERKPANDPGAVAEEGRLMPTQDPPIPGEPSPFYTAHDAEYDHWNEPKITVDPLSDFIVYIPPHRWVRTHSARPARSVCAVAMARHAGALAASYEMSGAVRRTFRHASAAIPWTEPTTPHRRIRLRHRRTQPLTEGDPRRPQAACAIRALYYIGSDVNRVIYAILLCSYSLTFSNRQPIRYQ
jgi:hypothetical protein